MLYHFPVSAGAWPTFMGNLCLQDQEAEIDAEIARLDALKDAEMFSRCRVPISGQCFDLFCGQEDDLEELRRKRLEQMKSVQAATRRTRSSMDAAWDAKIASLLNKASAVAISKGQDEKACRRTR